MNPKYSIITPVFNSFNLMHKYFESLNNQTYQNFEVIIVDDYSTDGSYEEVCKYAQNSSLSISVYRTEKNMGPGNARNIGIDAATGEWITFIDNDDWIDIDMIEKIDTVIEREKPDCIIFDYYIINKNRKKVEHSMYNSEGGFVPLDKCISNVRNHTCGKVYKLAKLRQHKVFYPQLRRCEDVAFVCRAIDACGSVYYMDEPLYYYYQRSSSLSNNKHLDEADMIKAFTILDQELGNKYPFAMKEKSVFDLLYGVLLMMCKAQKSNKEIKNYIDIYEQKYPMWWKCNSVKYIGKAKEAFLIAAKLRQPFIMKQLAFIHDILVSCVK